MRPSCRICCAGLLLATVMTPGCFSLDDATMVGNPRNNCEERGNCPDPTNPPDPTSPPLPTATPQPTGTPKPVCDPTLTGSWKALSDEFPAEVSSNASAIAMDVDANGAPHLAWVNRQGLVAKLMNYFWSGSQWAKLGDDSERVIDGQISMAVDSQGRRHMTWAQDDGGGNFEIHYRHWDGTNWQQYANSDDNGGISKTSSVSRNPMLKLDSLDRPYVVWMDGVEAKRKIFLKYWTGSGWMHFSGAEQGLGYGNDPGTFNDKDPSPQLALDSRDRPHIAWQAKKAEQSRIDYLYWDGAVWSRLGGVDGSTGVFPPVKPDGTLVFPPEYSTVFRKTFESILKGKTLNQVAMVIGGDNVPFLAFTGNFFYDTPNVYILQWHWDSKRWLGFSESLKDGGITKLKKEDGKRAGKPAFRFAGKERVHVMYVQDSGDNTTVYLRYVQWDGTQWTPQEQSESTGSEYLASDLTEIRSEVRPTMAMDQTDNPNIAWISVDPQSRATRINARAWVGECQHK